MTTKMLMENWLNTHGIIDKDKIMRGENNAKSFRNRENLFALPFEAEIDLHAVRKNEVGGMIDDFIKSTESRGMKKVKIVHGKGLHSTRKKSTIYETVISFIRSDERCGAYGFCSDEEGGEGATWIILEKNISK